MKSLIRETRAAYGRMLAKCWPALLVVFVPIEFLSAAFSFGGADDLTVLKVDHLLYDVFGILAYAMVLRFLVAEHEGMRKSCWELLNEALHCWGRLFKAGLIVGLLGILLLCCLVVPGVIWFVFYAFTTCCVVIGGMKAQDAMAESKRLVKGAWWRTFGVFGGLFLIVAMISFAALFGLELGVSGLESVCGDEEFLPDWFLWVYAAKDFVGGLLTDFFGLFVGAGAGLFYFRRKKEVAESIEGSI